MGYITTMIALDANAMTYFIQGMNCTDERPPEGAHAHEIIALVRIFFWMPSDACFVLPPTVEAECQKIRDQAKREDHKSWNMVHLAGVHPRPDEEAANRRATELSTKHNGLNDCKIAAECELADIDVLLTCDPSFLKRLRTEVRKVRMCSPSEYWEWMRIAKGAPPQRRPAEGNPLAEVNWWHL